MRHNSIRFFYQVMTGQIFDLSALRSLRWFMVPMAWVMLFGGVAIARYSWSKNSEQRTARHFLVFSMRLLSAAKWYLGIICARGRVAAEPAARSFGLADLHGMRLVRLAPGKGPAALALTPAS